MLEKKLHEELKRFNAINRYASKMIMEQEVPTPEEPAAGDIPPPIGDETGEIPPPPMGDEPLDTTGGETPPPIDDVPLDTTGGGMDTTEEMDITDLVNMTKSIKKDISDNKSDHDSVLNKMDDVFTKLTDLERKLEQMDSVMARIEDLDSKIENIKEPSPEERLEMRSLDSYPFNKNPQQFFNEKQGEMRQSGKNEYVLTKQEIEDYPVDTIKQTFNSEDEEDEFGFPY